jgi:hypothetical protein
MQMLLSQEYFSLMMGDAEVGDDVEFYMLKKISPIKAQQLVESDQPVAFCPKGKLISLSRPEVVDRTGQSLPAESRENEGRAQFLFKGECRSENEDRLS